MFESILPALTPVAFGAGIGAVTILRLSNHLYRDYPVPPLGRLVLEMSTRGRIEKPSNPSTIRRRIGQQVETVTDVDILRGRPRAGSCLTLSMCGLDLSALRRDGGLDALPAEIAEAYALAAARNGWRNAPTRAFTIYIVTDDSARPNFPIVSTGAPINAGTGITVPLKDERLAWPAARDSLPLDDDQAPAAPQIPDETQPEPSRHVPLDATVPIVHVASILRDGRVITDVTTSGITIGRAPTSDVRVDDRSVSRAHARINVQNGEVLLEPEPGAYCYVNQVLITGPTVLHVGDILTFGEYPQPFVIGKAAS